MVELRAEPVAAIQTDHSIESGRLAQLEGHSHLYRYVPRPPGEMT